MSANDTIFPARRRRVADWTGSMLAFVAPAVLNAVLTWLPYRSSGGASTDVFTLLFGIVVVVGFFVGGPLLLLVLAFPGLRLLALRCLVTVSLAFAGWACGGWVGITQIEREVTRFATRSGALVAAIEDYESKEGRAPSDLAELVPTYLDAVPVTGFSGHPDFVYQPGEAQRRQTWSLRVSTADAGDRDSWLIHDPEAQFDEARGKYSWITSRYGDWSWTDQ
jgi:hypothetical protein